MRMKAPRGNLLEDDMISMTYGVLPTFEQFAEAFAVACPDGEYEVKAGPLHDEFEAVGGSGLDVPAGCSSSYDVKRLWRLVRELTAIWEDEMDYDAGDDASSILFTLGIEWV
jgi:hypothetical protein